MKNANNPLQIFYSTLVFPCVKRLTHRFSNYRMSLLVRYVCLSVSCPDRLSISINYISIQTFQAKKILVVFLLKTLRLSDKFINFSDSFVQESDSMFPAFFLQDLLFI